jgi:hypothetical protein
MTMSEEKNTSKLLRRETQILCRRRLLCRRENWMSSEKDILQCKRNKEEEEL